MLFAQVKEKIESIIPEGEVNFFTSEDELPLSDACLQEVLQPCWVKVGEIRFPIPGFDHNSAKDILEYVERACHLESMRSFEADLLLVLVNCSYEYAVYSDLTNVLFIPFPLGSNKIVYGEDNGNLYIAYHSGCGVNTLTLCKVHNGYEEIPNPLWMDSVNSEIDLLDSPVSNKMPSFMKRTSDRRDYWGHEIWISAVSCHAAVRFTHTWVPLDKNWLSENYRSLPASIVEEYELYLSLQNIQ